MKKHNYSAGPCILPQGVFEKAAQAILNFNDSGLSILEISHRSADFVKVMEEARALALELLGLEGKGYQALFLQGGASLEFLRVPQNLMQENGKAVYLDTGTWANSAIKEARAFGETIVAASSKEAKDAAKKKWEKLKKSERPENLLNFGGQNNELWVKGGEETFVREMAKESQLFGISPFILFLNLY